MKITITAENALKIHSVIHFMQRESPQIQDNLKKILAKILPLNGKKADFSTEIDFTDSERISMYRCIENVLLTYTPDEKRKSASVMTVFEWCFDISIMMEFDKQLSKKLNLEKEVEPPKDFKFNDEFDFTKEEAA